MNKQYLLIFLCCIPIIQSFIVEPSACLRTCTVDSPPMECRYKFVIENYQSLSRACYDCPNNQTDCLRPDCVAANGFSRSVSTINRRIPGPDIQVCLGDTIVVDVENHLAIEETTIHWHGNHQKDTPHMDGVPYITQCPIASGTSFQYKFKASRPGTEMWHSHTGNQRGDGVFGAVVTRQPKELDPLGQVYDYDSADHVIVITDWSKSPVHELYVNYYNNGIRIPISTVLVNGLGYFLNSTYKSGVPPAKFNVEKGYLYRFRLVNAAFMMCPIEISVDNHTMTVISTDGYDVKPFTVSSIVTYTGERFDFVINADQDIDNYWIRFRGLVSCSETKAHQVAVLNYAGADSNELPKIEPVYEHIRDDGFQLNSGYLNLPENKSVNIPELDGIQADDASLKEIPDKKFYIHFDFYNVSNSNYYVPGLYDFDPSTPRSSKTPQINHITFAAQSFPLLSQRDQIKPNMFCNESTVTNCTTEFCQCTHVIQVPLNETVEIVLVDMAIGNSNHPFHLHGYGFRVIGMGTIEAPIDIKKVKMMDALGLLPRKLHNAPMKDTVTVPTSGYTIIRVLANNPGYWLFHCHIDIHATVGMALVFKVGEHKDLPPIPKDFPKCGNYNSAK